MFSVCCHFELGTSPKHGVETRIHLELDEFKLIYINTLILNKVVSLK